MTRVAGEGGSCTPMIFQKNGNLCKHIIKVRGTTLKMNLVSVLLIKSQTIAPNNRNSSCLSSKGGEIRSRIKCGGEVSPILSIVGPHWLLYQIAFIKVHKANRWRQDSTSALQREQEVSPKFTYLLSSSFVGRQLAAILNKWILSLMQMWFPDFASGRVLIRWRIFASEKPVGWFHCEVSWRSWNPYPFIFVHVRMRR